MFPLSSWLDQPHPHRTNTLPCPHAPPPPPPDRSSIPGSLCTLCKKVWLSFAVLIFCRACCASRLLCANVCACVCRCVHTHTRFHLFTHCTRYSLSTCSVPGTVAKFLWVCLSMPLLLLWGPLRASLSPNCYLFVSLGVSGSVCPCVCFCPRFSAGLCSLPFLGSASALWTPLVSLGFCKAPGQPQGPPAALTSPCLSLHSLPASPLPVWFPQSHF